MHPIYTAPRDGTLIDLFGVNERGHHVRWPDCKWSEGHWEQQYAELPGAFFNLDQGYTAITWLPIPEWKT